MRDKLIRLPRVAALAAVTLSLAVGLSLCQEDGNPVSIGTYRMLNSRVLNEDRVLLVNLPKGYDETDIGYPVLFILYGGQVRGYFAEAVHVVDRLHEAGLIPPMIIVGVKNVDRYRDNLPVGRNGEKGGADRFLRFISDELIPFIGASYRTKDFRVLLGPQAGAAFALYALMENPGLFRVNIVTNPFWNRWSRDYLMEKAGYFFDREGPLRSFLFITCDTGDDNDATMEYLDRLVSIVEEGDRSGFEMVLNRVQKPGEGIPSPGLREGLARYFAHYAFPEDREIGGLEDLRQYYRDLSTEYGFDVDMPEFTLIREGRKLEEIGKIDEAQAAYEYVVEHYPYDLNSYFSLAELHRREGDYDLAVQYYERFLERQHESLVAERLESLRRFMEESAAYAVGKSMMESGVEAGIAAYRDARAGKGKNVHTSEREFNDLGYILIGKGMLEAAIEVFKMNVEMYRRSPNAYDSLAEAYMMNGDRELAIQNYRKSLELNPDNENAREKLRELGEE
jgi:predicted alpha/beta superfamily hydrolase/TolA-binding protein